MAAHKGTSSLGDVPTRSRNSRRRTSSRPLAPLKSHYLRAALEILRAKGASLSPKDIIDIATREKLFPDSFFGKTPHQTLKSKLSVHIRTHGEKSPFVRTNPGRFSLRSLVDPSNVYYARPLQHPPPAEQVLVIERDFVALKCPFQGIRPGTHKLLSQVTRTQRWSYLDRVVAESNDQQKQVVTYVVVCRGTQLLAFKRGTFSNAERSLRGAHCIGFGGHVTQADRTLFANDLGVTENVVRELSEELALPNEDKKRLATRTGLEWLGILNDDSSPAGRRHLALVFKYDVSGDPAWDVPRRNEKSITQLRWLAGAPEPTLLNAFEYWSQLCLLKFFGVRATSSFKIVRREPLRPAHILCVIGSIGSGKSSATAVLTGDFAYEEINTGAIVADIVRLPPVPSTPRATFQRAAQRFISSPKGPRQLAHEIFRRAQLHTSPRILVDGIRHPATLRSLRAVAVGRRIGVLFIQTPPHVAFEFYRRRTDPRITIEQFLKLREAPVEREVDNLIGEADAVLYNWRGISGYKRAIHSLMREVLL